MHIRTLRPAMGSRLGFSLLFSVAVVALGAASSAQTLLPRAAPHYPSQFTLGKVTYTITGKDSTLHLEFKKLKFVQVRSADPAHLVSYNIVGGAWHLVGHGTNTSGSNDCIDTTTGDETGDGVLDPQGNAGQLLMVPVQGKFAATFTLNSVHIHVVTVGCHPADNSTDQPFSGGWGGNFNPTDVTNLSTHAVSSNGDALDVVSGVGLTADAGGPYTCVRGQSVQLDGTHSTGAVTYHWTFSGAGNGPTPNRGNKSGAQPRVTALGNVNATLTVEDGDGNSDSDTALITVTPRTGTTWKTPRVGQAREQKLTTEHAPSLAGWVGGETRCSFDPAEPYTQHFLHPGANGNGTWEGGGYTLAQVTDPDGPFDGWFYVDSYLLKCSRVPMVNQYILPDAPSLFADGRNFYAGNQWAAHQSQFSAKHINVASYLKAVRAHELRHISLLKAALPANDPAPKVEALYAQDRLTLRYDKVDQAIKAAEDALDKASGDPLAQTWDGWLVVPDAHGGYQTVETTVGEPGGH